MAAGAVLVVLVLVVAAVVWYESQAGGDRGAPTIVTIAPGDSMGSVIATLVRAQVVDSSLAFRVYLTLHGTPVVQPGSYLLHRHDPFADIRSQLAGGPDVFPVTVLAGFTIGEVAERVGQVPGHDGAHFLSVADSGALRSPFEPAGSTNLDGLVGTGTYLVVPGESDQTLLGDMIDRFDTLADATGLSSGAAALGETPYQAITVASIVQKEGVYQKNLGKVSRVIYNRLARGTPLQMDSTVLYSEHRDGGPVSAADLALNTPYNTYLHTGLTPTPICFPSKASLQAALAPTPGPWVYFVVVSKDGTEAFSSTFAGQQANERLAQSRGLG
ncbi:MAG TPA: endolytic transglycosylase MltG [Acidimicrobiales bacterium]|nr:endolytic transglycosylase MltG [Acidimicrobiales bacterium]